ncbi:MAG: PH domain-containing protein [Phycisphaerales bacterium]|nr:PH domain-containing protein [Phycisphaerales bacterium]
MIRFQCDKCEQELSFDDAMAGDKVECPYCGDVNRIPEATTAPAAADEGTKPSDRATAAGLPPDSGPEQTVMLMRPSIWRAFPFRSGLLTLLPIVVPIAMRAVFVTEWKTTGIAFLVAAGLCWLPLAAWWVVASRGVAVKLTNKRTIERRGLLTRATSEVLHDHVRNIQIEQSFLNRIFRVGDVGISSSGQDGIEIQLRHIPNPDRMKEIIDKYRPM